LPEGAAPIRLAIVDDYELVVQGVHALLAEYSDRVVVVELDRMVPVASDVDVILYDTFANLEGRGTEIEELTGPDVKVAVFAWTGHHDSIARALDRGATGYLSKSLAALELVESLEQIAEGKQVISPEFATDSAEAPLNWPWRSAGLSARESEIVALIASGLSNEEIAHELYLSINTVKTYIRSGYAKIGVHRRSQAVAWAIENGLRIDPGRETQAQPGIARQHENSGNRTGAHPDG
jgi:NarL family two-component system response regulator LiaR